MFCCINETRKLPLEGVCETIEEKLATVSKPKFNAERFTRDEWEALPDPIEYRMLRYRTHVRKKEIVIVTTLTDSNQYSAEQIAELYGLRWDVEIDISAVKSTMGMCDLLSQNPANIDCEIVVGILAHNLVRALKSDATAATLVHPREISFSSSRDAWIL